MTPHALEDQILDLLPKVQVFLHKLTGNRTDAEDLAQDTVERSLRYRDSFDPSGSLPGWLMKTAFRCFLDHRARQQRQPTRLGDAVDSVITVSRTAEDRDQVRHVLQKLNPIEQDILLRFHHRGESLAEIAAALGTPINTVKSHLHRARRKIARDGADDGSCSEDSA